MSEKLYTVPQVAEYLGVAEQTVRNLLLSGKLPVVRVAGHYRISEGALSAWVAAGGAGSRKPCGKRETSATAQLQG